MHADIILLNGRIFKGLRHGFAEALAIRDGRVLAVGSQADVDTLRGAQTRVVDLAGRVAIPGFNDAHMHLLPVGVSMSNVDVSHEDGVRTVDDVLQRIGAASRTKKPGEWIIVRGYDQNDLAERRHPTAEEIDRVAPDHPVYVKRKCGHVSVINSRAMALAGITLDTPEPSGGLIERRDGRLTGMIAENAIRLVTDITPKPDHAAMMRGVEQAGARMVSQGITSTMDAAVGMHAGMPELGAYEELARTGRLPLRVWVCLYGNTDGIAEEAYAAGYRFGREVGLLRYGAMKIFADGATASMTAAMTQPYLAGDPANRGVFIYSDKEMHELLARYHRQGYQLAIHAIGDAAIEQVLSGIEKADSAEQPILGRRHRIEHCSFGTDSQFARMAKAGIDPVPQPVFLRDFGDTYFATVGRARADRVFPMRKWLDAGFNPAASSDAPVADTDPFRGLHAMVARRTPNGEIMGPLERLTIEEAVHVYTASGAYTQFAEDRLGLLLPGYCADIAVLSHDIFAIPIDQVETGVACDMTLLDGAIVHDRLGQMSAATL